MDTTNPSYVLNLNEKMQDRIIQNSKDKISATNALIEKLMPKYEERKLAFEMARDEFDDVNKQLESMKSDIEDEICIIRTMKHFKDAGHETKELRISYNNTGAKVTRGGAPKRVNWLQAAYDIIQSENRFIGFEELWYKLGENKELVDAASKGKSSFSALKMAVSSNFKKHAANVNNSRGSFLVMYNDKFGIAEWMKGGKLDPKHLKEFMQTGKPMIA